MHIHLAIHFLVFVLLLVRFRAAIYVMNKQAAQYA